MTAIYSILSFILILLPLVILHEFGHYFSAKFFKIKVLEFGFGFPPKLFSYWSSRKRIYFEKKSINNSFGIKTYNAGVGASDIYHYFETIKSIKETRKVHFLNTVKKLTDAERKNAFDYFCESGHLNLKGNKLIAEIINDHLVIN